MRPIPKRQFLSDFERKAAERDLAIVVHGATRMPHYTLSLEREGIDRITFVLGSRQDISVSTCTLMLRSISKFLAGANLDKPQRDFGLAARELVEEMLEAMQAEQELPDQLVGPDDIVIDLPTTVTESAGFRPGLVPLRGADEQRAWYLAQVENVTEENIRGLGLRLEGVPGSRSRHGALAIEHHGTVYYPTFQFADGKVRPIVVELLGIFERHRSPWQTAFWFISANGWLDGSTPAHSLDDTAAVTAAAIHEVNALVA